MHAHYHLLRINYACCKILQSISFNRFCIHSLFHDCFEDWQVLFQFHLVECVLICPIFWHFYWVYLFMLIEPNLNHDKISTSCNVPDCYCCLFGVQFVEFFTIIISLMTVISSKKLFLSVNYLWLFIQLRMEYSQICHWI